MSGSIPNGAGPMVGVVFLFSGSVEQKEDLVGKKKHTGRRHTQAEGTHRLPLRQTTLSQHESSAALYDPGT